MLFPPPSNKESKNSSLTLSEFLPLGYLYVLLLGIMAESIYYGLIGINYLSYASILDVLLGPVAILTDRPLLFVLLLVAGAAFYALMLYKGKQAKKNPPKGKTVDGTTALLIVMGIMILAAFIGYGLGRGFKEKERLDDNEIEHNAIIHFLNGEQKEVRTLGNTSTFIFYVRKDQETISIAPISNNIQEIEQMK